MRAAATIVRLVARRLLQRRVVAFLVLAGLAPAVVVLAVPDDPGVAFHRWTTVLFVAVAMPIIGLVVSGAAFGDERSDGTFAYLVTKPVGRVLVAGAVTAAAIGAALAVGAAGLAGGWLVAAIRTGEAGIGVPPAAAMAVEAVGYGAVFVPLGLVARRATLAGLAYIFIWEAILTSAVETLASASLWRTGLSAYVGVGTDLPPELTEVLGRVTPGAGGAAAKVTVLTVISVAFTTWILRTRDLT